MRIFVLGVFLVGCGNVKQAVTSPDMAVGGSGDMAVAAGKDMATAGGADLAMPAGTDAGPTASCTSGQPCSYGGGNGLCVGGVCAACNDPTDDTPCATVYVGTLCIAGSCTVANCRTSADCGGQLCINNTCTKCVSDGDCTTANTICNTTSGACVTNASCGAAMNGTACPVNGADLCCGTSGLCTAASCCGNDPCKVSPASVSNDGTCNTLGMCVANACAMPTGNTRYVDWAAAAGGSGAQSCPFNTIAAALQNLGSNGGKVIVKGGSNGSSGTMPSVTLPSFSLAGGIELVGADSTFTPCTQATCPNHNFWATINFSGTGNGIVMNSAGDARTIHFFNLNGAGSATSTGAGVSVSGATVTVDHLFTQGFNSGIYAGPAAVVKINSGIQSLHNVYGVFVAGSATLAGGNIDIETAANENTIHFDLNTSTGIYCQGNGQVKAAGPSPSPLPSPTPNISASNNGQVGVRVFSSVGVDLSGVVAEGNVDGMLVYALSILKVRNSIFSSSSGSGVHVVANGTGNTGLAMIDFGTAADHGHNYFGTNTNTDICIDKAAALAAIAANAMSADGNVFGAQDCSASGTIKDPGSCTGGSPGVSDDCNAVLLISGCGVTGGCTPQ